MSKNYALVKDKINTDEYKQYSHNNFSRFHKITAYLAMFPPNLPYYFIKKYSQEGDLIFDPFSGRGTTPFEACRMGRKGIGNDLNPLAVCLTKSKVDIPKKCNILKRLQALEQNFVEAPITDKQINDIPNDIKMLYEESETLPQLVYLKNNLNKNRKIDNFILAVLTGIMHGKHRKDGTSIYCSIDMPNTFSMSPNYIRNFIAKHHLKKIKQNVFELLQQRIEHLFQNMEKIVSNSLLLPLHT